MDFLKIHGQSPIKIAKPWILKYAPKSLEGIVGNPKIIESLNYYLANKNIPNIIITGPNGVGKQTAVKCLVNEYLGVYKKEACLSIFGSISTGKDVVSEKLEQKKNSGKSYSGLNISNFIKRKLSLPKNLCKIIVIYDFDRMTNEAQMALRRIIELYSNCVRFIFTGNNISNIIEALQSRCVILKFTKLTDSEITKVLKGITKRENVDISKEVIDLICLASYGDLKQAINYVQILSFSERKDVDSFYKIFNIPPLDSIQKFIVSCLKKKTRDAYDIVIKLLTNGYNATDILDILLKITAFNLFKNAYAPGIKNGVLNPKIQIGYLKAINQCYFLTETTDSVTHLYYLISQLVKISGNPDKIPIRSNII